jgi:hypothetical protein
MVSSDGHKFLFLAANTGMELIRFLVLARLFAQIVLTRVVDPDPEPDPDPS